MGQRGRLRSDHLRLDAPADPGLRAVPGTAQLLAALGVSASGLPVESYTNGPTHMYVALPGKAAVTTLKPDISALPGFAGVSAYCFAGSGRHWRTRTLTPTAAIRASI
jgi:trans-2,3-dihydro-3-hydroxyanthranilate isomerase